MNEASRLVPPFEQQEHVGVCLAELSKGYYAIVDSSDAKRVREAGPWHARANGADPYAATNIRDDAGKWRTGWLHRLLLAAVPEELVDHKNGDTLDNRRSNLRTCSRAENARNQKRRSTNTSGYKGVYRRRSGRIRACIRANGKTCNLGTFDTLEEAARAYDDAAREHHGDFARLNFPSSKERAT